MNLPITRSNDRFLQLELFLMHPKSLINFPTILKIKDKIFSSVPSEEISNELNASAEVLKFLKHKSGSLINYSEFKEECPNITSMILVPNKEEDTEVDPPDENEIRDYLTRVAIKKCVNLYQTVSIVFFQRRYDYQIKALCSDSSPLNFGMLSDELKITLSNQSTEGILKTEDFDPVKFGIGGLKEAVDTIFKYIIAPRLLPPETAEELGIKYAKGVMLYGPPGNGKTLIARTFAKTLNVKNPIVVNGPEFLNRFVGEGEGKIRELFSKAIKEQALKGINSGLHLIIFDEFDAICKARGMDSGGHTDSLVNQLLACIDGVEKLNNILIFALTNRKDLIDPALLRPGRIEVHIEIGLPSVEGRKEILRIHSEKALKACKSIENINFDYLAARTKNFTGAELEGVVRRMVSEVMYNKGIDQKTKQVKNRKLEDITITQEDYINAIKSINPMFGVDESLQNAQELVHPSPKFEFIYNTIASCLAKGEKMPLHSLLVSGSRGSGKTAMVSSAAIKSNYSYIKIIKSIDLVEFNEKEKVTYIINQFKNAYKSEKSLLILENIENIIEYIPLDKSFSKPIFCVLESFLQQETVKERSFMIVGTTKDLKLMNDIGLSDSFVYKIEIPELKSQPELEKVITTISNQNCNLKGISKLINSIPIKKLVSVVKCVSSEQSITKELIAKELDKRI